MPAAAEATSPFDAEAALDTQLAAPARPVRRHPCLGVGARGVDRDGRALPAGGRPGSRAGPRTSAAHRRDLLSRSPFMSAVIRSRQSLVAQADGRRASDKDLADRGHPVRARRAAARRRRGRGRPHRRAGRGRRHPPAAPGRPQLAAALAEAWTRRSQKRRTEQAEVLLGSSSPPAKAQSMDHLLGSACRQLAELGEVERACIFLLEDDQPRARAWPPTPTAAATWPPGSSSATPRSACTLAETVLRTGRADRRRPGLRAAVRVVGRQLRRRLRPGRARSAAARTWPAS